MEPVNQVLNTGRQAITNYNTAKIFGKNLRTITGSYTNSSGADQTISAGTLFGRIASTQELKMLQSSASDGSQFPLGFLLEGLTVDNGSTVELTLVVAGDVEESLITLTGYGDTLNSVISSRTLRDRIAADTEGIHLVTSTEHTFYDNQ